MDSAQCSAVSGNPNRKSARGLSLLLLRAGAPNAAPNLVSTASVDGQSDALRFAPPDPATTSEAGRYSAAEATAPDASGKAPAVTVNRQPGGQFEPGRVNLGALDREVIIKCLVK